MQMPPFLRWFWMFVFYGLTFGLVLGFETNLVCQNGVTLKAKCSDSQQEMMIYGDIINLGCLVLPNGKIQNQCNKGAELRKVSIFASEKIVFDRDVIEKGQLQLNIITPSLEVSSFRNITLNGGEKRKDYNIGAAHGSNHHPDGINGKPGKDGRHAGNFLGIGKYFVGGNNLVINANGGDGGSGQQGGYGADGIMGSFAIKSELYYIDYFRECELLRFSESIQSIYSGTKKFINKDGNEELFAISRIEKKPSYSYDSYLIYGNGPTPPGRGGNGGRAGNPGKAGSISLYEVCNFGNGSKVMKHSTDGKPGKKQGKGGKGGKCAPWGYNTLIVRYCRSNRINAVKTKYINNSTPICSSGDSGKDGVTANTKVVPKVTMDSKDVIATINDYEQYIIANLNSGSRKEFLRCIGETEKIMLLYGPLEFLNELQALENEFYKRRENDDYSPRYEALLFRIGKYSNMKSVQASPQDRKVLSFLYTAILGRINNIKNKLELNIVVDIGAYLEEIVKSLKSLRKDETEYYKIQLINKYRQKYIDFVDLNIKEAHSIIDNEILSQLNATMEQINGDVLKLVDEVKELQKEMERNLKELQEKREKLIEAIHREKAAGILNLVGKLISICPKKEIQLIGDAVQMTGEILNGFVDKPEINPLPELKTGIQYTIKKHLDLVDEEKSSFKLSLDEISRTANKDPSKYQNVLTQISNIKNELNAVKDFEDVQHLRDKLQNEIKILKNRSTQSNYLSQRLFWAKNKTEVITNPEFSFKSKQAVKKVKNKDKHESTTEKTDEGKKNITDVLVDVMDKATELPTPLLKILSNDKENDKKLAIINESIKNASANIEKLNEYETSIKNQLFPMLKNMQSDLKSVASSFETKSVVALDVSSWKVETVLSNVKSTLRKMTKGFESQELLVEDIEKIERVMNILIKVYSTIQNLQREKMTANYIADINSANANAVKIPDAKLRNATEYATILIKSNIIIQQHKILVKSFKHHVFPFAKRFFEGLIIPSTLESGKNIVEIVDSAERQILHLQNKLHECQIFLTKEKEYSRIGPFGSIFAEGLEPFFLWKNNGYKNEIAKLLSGEEITILADIPRSNLNLFAVKFQIIIVYLKAKTKPRQMELDKTLNFFDINATHSGYSHYRYKNQTYLITTEPISFLHSFMRYENSKLPMHVGGAYQTLLNQNPPVYLLSPYTTWKLKIEKSEVKPGGSFDTLLAFKDEVDIELAGKGFYISPKIVNALDYEVDKYYQPLY